MRTTKKRKGNTKKGSTKKRKVNTKKKRADPEVFVVNIENVTIKNKAYRRVLSTDKYTQLVVMNLLPLQEIGMEKHATHDQFIRIEEGVGKLETPTASFRLKAGMAMIIPAGKYHNVINTSKTHNLKLYTLYSPPNHPPNTLEITKQEE